MRASVDMLVVPMYPSNLRMEMDPQLLITPYWTIDVSDVTTVKVSNISLKASERDIKEFFSFSGDIEYVEMCSESERSQVAYVTFKDSQGADTAILLSGATIVDMCVTVSPVENYKLPPGAITTSMRGQTADSAVTKAEDVVSTMLAKGYVLGIDALNKAKVFDERHQLSSNASATIASINQKIGLTEKISIGTTVVNEKVKEVDERFQVSEMTRSAFAVAEQKVSMASTALMSNTYVSSGAAWFSNAFNMVAKAAGDLSTLTKEKVDKAEEDKREIIHQEHAGMVSDYARIHLDESLPGEPPIVPVDSDDGQHRVV